MANTFQTTSKIEKAIAFQWEAFAGFADHLTIRNDELPSSVDNTGYSKLIRRPSRVATTRTSVGVDYNLPGVTQPPVGYGNMVDASFPFTVSARFEANLQTSFEELMFKLDAKDAMDRHITPAIIDMRNQMNLWIAQNIEAAAGNTLITNGTADGYIEGLFKSRQLLTNRAGVVPGQDKSVIFNPAVMPVLGLGAAKIFQAKDADKTYASGEFAPVAGFNIYESPVLATPTYVGFGASAIVSAGQDVAGFLTASWTPTTSIAVTGATASTTFKAGTKFKFVDGTTAKRFVVPTIGTDAGFEATFTLVEDCLSDVAGAVTLKFSEPFIAGGAFQNVNSNLVAGTTKVVLVNTASTVLYPSYAFAKDAVWLGFPEVKVPSGVDKQIKVKVGGFNIALIEDHWPGTLTTTFKLVAFGAIGVAKPEALVAIY